jgi:hypothetical protein
MMLLAPLVLIGVLLLVAIPLARHRDPAGRAAALTANGWYWLLAFAGLAGLWIIGEAFADPGGWAALGLVASWLLPMLALALLAVRRPRVALPVLATAVALGLGIEAWPLLVPADRPDLKAQGPVGAVALFAVSVAVGVYGRRRPGWGGALLVVVALVPMVILALLSNAPLPALLGGSTAAVTVPMGVAGVLYLLGAWFARRARLPQAVAAPQSPVR